MTDKPTISYMSEGQLLEMKLDDIVRVVKALEENGRLEEFVTKAKNSNAFATFDAKSVNFVKEFFAEHDLHKNSIGAHILKAPGPAAELASATHDRYRFRCNFGHG